MTRRHAVARLGSVAVVGSGPNGLAAAVTLARAGLAVEVFERNDWAGGGAATREITLPGFRHDVASAVHPMALASPFFREFGLARRIDLVVPEVSFAHPLPGRGGHGYRDLDRTAADLGRDGPAYRRLLRPLVDHLDGVVDLAMNPLLRLPRDPLAAGLYGVRVAEAGSPAWGARFDGDIAPAMLTGCAAHAIGRHPGPAAAGGGLLLAATAHRAGWPIPVGGSQSITDALVADLRAHGGRLRLGTEVTELRQLDGFDAAVLDVSARALATLGGDRLPDRYRRALARFRPGDGVSKVDFALAGPVPWSDPVVGQAPTVHLGGTRAQIAAAERMVLRGGIPEHPYVLVAQPSVVDPSRAPDGKAVLWAYLHVPFGSDFDATQAVTAAVEEHAPGFRDLVLASTATPATELGAAVSANFAGGDFASGAITMRQLIKRPVLSPVPWRTPLSGVYLASGATSPGPAVHGMAGWHAARTLLSDNGFEVPQLGPGVTTTRR
ncbi:phytoene desaturase family protein [Flexivirga oryzae]|uniref:Phytoene dehydrogenase-like protein n=1 Tax=Flexivirga oryzae TaxID=1794944 RepID=A0A839NEN9_9MICO|nr:NAD(P)/FAD-dependent oxidoreductase [Flexivirga oryzae]MBB2893161.1 phytoene dehydrogenase-like protein [Flexivirga oryzae]